MQPSVAECAPYEVLSRIYDRWVRPANNDRMAERILEILRGTATARPSCLDVCCGTGTLAITLADAGFAVTGIDASGGMLEVAATKVRERGLEDRITLHRLDAAHDPWPDGPFDLVTCTFDSVNYFSHDEFAAIAARARRTLRPGGMFVFDINTEHKMRSVFGNSVYAETFDDYAYIWNNALDEPRRTITFTITMFLRNGGDAYTRHLETHRQYLHGHEAVLGVLREAGFDGMEAHDDYSERSPRPDSMRLTYVGRSRE